MKKSILLVTFLSIASTTLASGIGVHSTGARMGQLTKFSIKGMTVFTKSGEGQMLMGSESTPLVVKDKDGNDIIINPWYFSSQDKSIRAELDRNIGEYVVLDYKQARIKNPNVDTEYEITKVSLIGPPLHKVCTADKFAHGHKSLGKRVGRIVKASSKGTIAKSWEILIQQGNSGNQFKHMSISDDENLFECAMDYLRAGQKVKITYDESIINMNIFSRDTKYDIVKIEPIKSLN